MPSDDGKSAMVRVYRWMGFCQRAHAVHGVRSNLCNACNNKKGEVQEEEKQYNT